MNETPICDFCSTPNPERTFDCPDFPMDKSPGYPELRSKGAWQACSVCGTLIDQENWNGLLLRAVNKLGEKYDGIMPRRILTDTIRRSHDMFREHCVKEKMQHEPQKGIE
jgi:hypothetical protein